MLENDKQFVGAWRRTALDFVLSSSYPEFDAGILFKPQVPQVDGCQRKWLVGHRKIAARYQHVTLISPFSF